MSAVVSGGVAWHPVGPILFWDQSNTPCTTNQNGTNAHQSKPEPSFRKASQTYHKLDHFAIIGLAFSTGSGPARSRAIEHSLCYKSKWDKLTIASLRSRCSESLTEKVWKSFVFSLRRPGREPPRMETALARCIWVGT